MFKSKPGYSLSISAAALIAVFTVSAIGPASAQERKSIRWATSSVDSYGYKVAAAMVKIAEDALGGQYTITVNPYPSTTGAMKAAMDGTGEIGYTADVGMTQIYAGEGGFKNYTPAKGKLVHAWYSYPMESFMATSAKEAGKYKCWGDFSGKPVFFTTAGFMNWLNFSASTRRWATSSSTSRSTPRPIATHCRVARSPARSPTPPPAARSRVTGRRPTCAWT